jgi:alpha-D-xyloside xylohydrolase
MRWLLALTLLAFGISALPATASPELTWRADVAPFRLQYVHGNRVLTGQASSRMTYLLADGAVHRVTDVLSQRQFARGTSYTVGTDEPDRTAHVTVLRTERGLRVSWTFSPSTGVVQVRESLTGDTTEHFLGGGTHTMFVDLRGQVLLNKAVFVGASTFGKCNKNGAPSPFFISNSGYGIYPDTTAIGRLAFPGAAEDTHCDDKPAPCPVEYGKDDRIQLCFKTDRLDYEVYAGDPARVSESYFARVGRPTLPPPRQFALLKWRDKINHSDEVVEDVVEFQNRGVPLDSVWVDNPWEQSPPGARVTYACIGALAFDDRQFPDAQGLIDWMRSRGVNLGVWVAPFLSKSADGKPCLNDYPPGSFVQSDRTNVWDLDFTNPAARAHYEAKLEKVFRMGVNFVKGDRGDEHNLEESVFQGGPGTLLHNKYPQLYAESVVRVLRKVHGDNYLTLFRGGYDGMPTVLRGFWAADADTSFDGLRLTLRRGLNSWIAGHPVHGSDTGGYRRVGADPPSPSLFTRWAQLSAVSPVFQVGGSGRNATPWVYDSATFARFRSAAVLHYELFPYLYQQAALASATGVPITRPMAFSYPSSASAWAADQQMMIGPDLVAAPVTADRAEADGAAGLPTPVPLWLPPGEWIDLFNGSVASGHVVRSSTLDEFPLYLRSGSAIPFNLRTPDVWASPWGVNDLDRRDRAGWLVSPSAAGRFSSPYGGVLASRVVGSRLVLTLSGAPAESQVVVPGVAATAVSLNGLPVSPSSVDVLRGQASGWTTTSGAFGGTVLKLHGGVSTAVISLR